MATITVTTLDDENDGGATEASPGGTGLSLREAIALANSSVGVDDTIVFDVGLAAGTIRLTHSDGTLQVSDELTIDGDIDNDGAADILITGDVNDDDTTVGATDVTDIFASGATVGDNVRIIGATADLTLDGLILTGGVAADPGEDGGAVEDASLTGVTITLTNATVSGNSAVADGGGISANTVTLTNSTVSGNSAVVDGGGIHAGTVTLTNSTVSDNSTFGLGGGIDAGTATLTNSTVSGNSAEFAGGIVATTATLTNSTVSDNSAGTYGGGLYTGNFTLANSTVSGNSAGEAGGGIDANTVTLINSTVSGNSADVQFGGILASTANFTNSIALGNDAPTDAEVSATTTNRTGGNIVGGDVFQGNTDVGNTTAADVFAATVDIGGGVLAGVLADNGGPVQTIALKEDASNPAIDAGDDGQAPDLDARGFSRDDFAGAANNGTNISDLGAFELSHDIVVTTLDDVVDAGDDLISLREAIALANASDGADTITFDASLGAGGTIRLTNADGTLQATDELTIDGDINDDGVADILITGDNLGNDVTPTGDVTDIAASGAVVVGTGTALSDNVRIFNATANLTLDGLTLTGGVAGASGGAIFGTTVTLTNSIVSGNRAGVSGGGLRATTVTLTDSTVSDNQAGNTGGGIRADDVATLTNSTVSGNRADIGGGVGAHTATLTNSTVSGNRAEDGNGGGIMGFVVVALTNSTVSGNSAVDDGGGINAFTANLTNSIVLGNDATTNDEVSAVLNRVGGNIVGTNVFHDEDDVGNTTAAAVFAATVDIGGGVFAGVLADNGGPVQTIALKRDLSNPALDASDNSAPPNDARGEARQDWAGIANNGSPADLGAYELQNTAPTAINLTHTEHHVEDGVSFNLVDIVVSDADVGDTITARLTLANPAAGALTTSGAATYNAGTGVWTITGTVAQVNAALAAAAFVPAANFNGDTAIATHIEDAQGDGPADGTISLDGTPVNDAPVIGPLPTSVAIAENTTAVTTATATDIDAAIPSAIHFGPGPHFSLSGDDAALFAINAATGALVFKVAPDFGAPGDAGGNNVYDVIARASDGTLTDTQALTVTVGDVDGVTITGTKGKDKVNATKTVKGEPLPTGEEDLIVGKGRKDKLSGLDGDDTIGGGGGRDVLKGGAGDDRLAGGGGRDKYIGGDGIDSFVFDTKVTPTGLFDHLSMAAVKRRADKIVDYEKDEKIILDSDVFKGLDKGALGADQFHIGEEAEAATHRIIYDESAGLLIFDRNGSAVAGDAVIARVGKNLGHLDHNDILVA